jgi:hypothetical protein
MLKKINVDLVKLIAAIILFICPFDMLYWFYDIVRTLALIGFGFLAFDARKKRKNIEAVIFLCLAILFQPILKIHLTKAIWIVIDLVVGIWLLISLFIKEKKEKPIPKA